MKKQIVIKLLFLIIVVTINSCQKKTENSSASLDLRESGIIQKARALGITGGVIDSTIFNNYVAIMVSQTASGINRDSSYQASAFARISENNVPVNAGPLNLNGRIIMPGPDNLYSYIYSKSEGKALLGNTIQTQISDSVVNSTRIAARLRNVVMTVPKEIFPITLKLPKGFIDRNLNDTLKWNPDLTNQFGKVQITFSYYKGISQFNAANMPVTISNLSYTVTDNGTFVIPKSDLARFPQGSYVGISIARAWVDNTSNRIAYISIAEAHTVPLLVIDTAPIFSITNTTVSATNPTTCNESKLSTTATITGGVYPLSYLWTITPYIGGSTLGTPITFTTAFITNASWVCSNGGRCDLQVTDAVGRVVVKNGLIFNAPRRVPR